MTAAIARIVSLYENGLSPGEIASEEGLDIMAVKSVLVAHCVGYREQAKEGEEEEISKEEYNQFLEAYKMLALSSENELVREKSLRFLINEKKGRNDAVKEIATAMKNVNVLVFNEHLEAARRAISRVITKPVMIEDAVVVGVPTEVTRVDNNGKNESPEININRTPES